jgi:hypothetical protein
VRPQQRCCWLHFEHYVYPFNLQLLHAAGTLFEIGSWLLYWEALNPDPHVVTGRELQQPLTKQQHSNKNSHSRNHIHDDGAKKHAVEDTYSRDVPAGANVQGDQQTAHDTRQLHPAGASSSHTKAAGSEVEPSSSAACTVPGTLYYAVNKRPRIAAYQQVQQLTQAQQQQPRRRWKPAAANSTQQQHVDVEAPIENAAYATAQHTRTTPAVAAARSTTSNVGAAAGELVTSRTPCSAGQRLSWRWWGLRLHDIGFMVSLLQLIGATIFWVSLCLCVPLRLAQPGCFAPNDPVIGSPNGRCFRRVNPNKNVSAEAAEQGLPTCMSHTNCSVGPV